MTLTVHAFDYFTRRYRGKITLSDSDVSPDGDLIIPGDCTATAPPREGEWVWDGEAWQPWTPPPASSPAPPPAPRSITRRQCARQLMVMAFITGEEAIAMAATATPPRAVAALINALPSADQIIARIDFAADSYARANPLISGLMHAAAKTEADIDEFFRAAALI